MNQLSKSLLVIILGCAISLPALADMFSHSPSCSKPYKSSQLKTQNEVDKFNDYVESYRKCLSEFIEEQQESASRHQQSAIDANNEWNRYVTNELNQ